MDTLPIDFTNLSKETKNKIYKFVFIFQIKININILILWTECHHPNDTGSEFRKTLHYVTARYWCLEYNQPELENHSSLQS